MVLIQNILLTFDYMDVEHLNALKVLAIILRILFKVR